MRQANRETRLVHLNEYETLLQKHASLSDVIAKCAAEGRAPSEEEQTTLNTLKSEIEALKSGFESRGREAFLAGVQNVKKSDAPVELKAADSFAKHVEGTYPTEHKNLSIGRILRGYVTGDWTGAELEMKAMGSTPVSSGGVMIPTPLAASIIDLARNKARLLQAGAVTVPMTSATLKYARMTSDVTANWTGEGTDIAISAGSLDSVIFTAHKLAALVPVNNELLEDAQNADAAIENSIAQAVALALDLSGLYGTGVAPQPHGLHGVAPTQAGSEAASYDDYLDAIATIRGNNFEPNGVIYNAGVSKVLSALKDSEGRYLAPPDDYVKLAKYVTQQIPTTTGEASAFVGQWDQLALGLRSSLQIEISREGGYLDGSTAANAFSRDQTIIRAILRADWQPFHSAAFVEITGNQAA